MGAKYRADVSLTGNENSQRPGRWGNPFRVSGHRTAAEAVGMFRDALLNGELPYTVEDIQKALGQKNLDCWCRLGDPCHGDVLLQVANKRLR